MKKKLVLLLTSALVLTCLGCGDAAKTPVETPAVDTVVEAEDTQTEEVVPETTPEEEATPEVEEEPIAATYLRDLFAEHGMKVGTCLTTQMIKNAKQEALIKEQFSSVTMENSMKPDYIFDQAKSKESGELTVVFNKDMTAMLDWAKENNMAVRGHTLVWYSQTPGWIFHEGFDLAKPLVGREEMLNRLESMIKQMFTKLQEEGYADLFYAYDVANEAWMEDGSIRESDWTRTIGEDYLWHAFYFANKYAPENIDLYYNDYNEQFKADTFVKFVKTLVDEDGNYLIDGIGLQAHLYTQDDIPGYFRAVDKLASTGLKLEMTELDVSLGAWQKTLPATDENLRDQGKYYYNLINGIFERVDNGTISMDSLTIWGFSDGLSWRKNASPLLYNAKLEPKYSYYGTMQMKELAGFEE